MARAYINNLSSLVLCIPDEADACKKENGPEHPGKNDRFNVPGTFAAIHETYTGIDQAGNSQKG